MSQILVVPDPLGGRAGGGSAFSCSRTSCGFDTAHVSVAGELDLATMPRLEQMLRQPQLDVSLVVLDLRQLEFIDSCGVHAIVNASVRARLVGHRMIVLRGPPNVDRMFSFAESADRVEMADVNTLDPHARALLGLARRDRRLGLATRRS